MDRLARHTPAPRSMPPRCSCPGSRSRPLHRPRLAARMKPKAAMTPRRKALPEGRDQRVFASFPLPPGVRRFAPRDSSTGDFCDTCLSVVKAQGEDRIGPRTRQQLWALSSSSHSAKSKKSRPTVAVGHRRRNRRASPQWRVPKRPGGAPVVGCGWVAAGAAACSDLQSEGQENQCRRGFRSIYESSGAMGDCCIVVRVIPGLCRSINQRLLRHANAPN